MPLLGGMDEQTATWGQVAQTWPTLIGGGFKEIGAGISQGIGDIIPGPDRFEEGAKILNEQVKTSLGELPKNKQTFWQSAATDAVVSMSLMAPGLAGSIATGTPAPMLAAMTASEAARSYNQARQGGLGESQAALYATLNGMVELGTEMIPAKVLFGAGTPFRQRLVQMMVAEPLTENLATVGQSVNAYLNDLDPETTAGDFLRSLITERIPRTTASTLITGPLQAGLGHGIASVMGKTVQAEAPGPLPMEGLDQAATDTPGPRWDQQFQQDTPEFKAWFGDSQAVDEQGAPKTLYHGTTFDFGTVDTSKGDAGGYFGKGFYMTDSPEDASNNYAGEGPDLTNKLDLIAEQVDEADVEAKAREQGLDPNALDRQQEQSIRMDIVREQYGSMHKGLLMPLYASIRNPADMQKSTLSFEYDTEHYQALASQELNPQNYADQQEYQDAVQERAQELMLDDPNPQGQGNLINFMENVRDLAGYYNLDGNQVLGDLQDQFDLYPGNDVKLGEVVRFLHDKAAVYAEDENGRLASGEYIRQILERTGYDGIIQHAGQDFPTMKGVTPDTRHYIAFQPNQVKSALGNSGEFSPTNPEIYRQYSDGYGRKARVMSEHPINTGNMDMRAMQVMAATPKQWLYDGVLYNRPSEAHYEAIANAIGDLHNAGMPHHMMELVSGLATEVNPNLDTTGGYFPTKGLISLNESMVNDALTNEQAARAIRGTIAHELGHALDMALTKGTSHTWDSPLFAADPMKMSFSFGIFSADPKGMGPIMSEVAHWYTNGKESDLHDIMAYPLARLGAVAANGQMIAMPDGKEYLLNDATPEAIKNAAREAVKDTMEWIQSETFAQLSSLYYNAPKQLQAALPKSYKFMQEVHNATQQTTSPDELSLALRKVFRTPGSRPGAYDARHSSETGIRAKDGQIGVQALGKGERRYNAETPRTGQGDTAGAQGDLTQTPTPEELARIRENIIQGGPVEGRAANVKVDIIWTGDDAMRVVKETALAMPDAMQQARRGTVSWDETGKQAMHVLAEATGLTDNILAKRGIGETFNAAEMEAAAVVLNESARQVKLKAKQYADTLSEADKAAFHESMMRHAMLQQKFTGAVAEAGRAMGIMRKLYQEGATYRDIGFIAEQAGKETVDNMAQMVLGLDTPGQIGKFAEGAYKTTKLDALVEAWIMGLLSGPQTHVVNMTSNALVSLLTTAENYIASGIGLTHKGDRMTFMEANARAAGLIRGGREGLHAAWESLKGVETEETLKSKIEHPPAIKGKIGEVVRIPGKALAAEDAIFKGIGKRVELNGLAARQAMADFEAGKGDFNTLYQDYLASPTAEMMKAARNYGEYITFQTKLGPISSKVSALVNSNRMFRFIMPFVRTPTNILKFAVARTPLGLAMSDVRADIAAGGARADVAKARILTGTAIMTSVAALAANGLITGSGPSDPRERMLWRMTGAQPHSIKIGDRYYSYGRLEPIGMLFGLAADFADIAHKMPEQEASEVAASLAFTVSKNLTSKTWLKGLSETVRAIEDPDTYGKYWLQNFAGSFVPAIVAQAERIDDPVQRDARNIVDKWRSRVPGMSEELPPTRTLWGDPVTYETFGLTPKWADKAFAAVSPVYTSTATGDRVSEEMLRLGIFIGKPQRKLGGVDLTEEQYSKFVELAGKMAKERLDIIVGGTAWSSIPDAAKERTIRKIVTQTRNTAAAMMIAENPSIVEERVKKKLQSLGIEAGL